MVTGKDDDYFVRIDETLVGRKPGASAGARARQLRSADSVGALTSRILGRHTDERAWAKEAFGERVVGWMLGRLPEGWYVFHDVPVGNRGTNIDHILVGPAGVFILNTKYFSGTVRVAPRPIRVNGVPKDFLPRSVHEAGRAARRCQRRSAVRSRFGRSSRSPRTSSTSPGSPSTCASEALGA